MPHGDLSDYVAVASLALGLGSIFAPAALYSFSAGPLKPMVEGAVTEAAASAMRLAGAAFIFVGTTSFGVRWNTVNHVTRSPWTSSPSCRGRGGCSPPCTASARTTSTPSAF